MVATARKKKKNDAENTFFLYVAFHAALTAIANFFQDND